LRAKAPFESIESFKILKALPANACVWKDGWCPSALRDSFPDKKAASFQVDDGWKIWVVTHDYAPTVDDVVDVTGVVDVTNNIRAYRPDPVIVATKVAVESSHNDGYIIYRKRDARQPGCRPTDVTADASCFPAHRRPVRDRPARWHRDSRGVLEGCAMANVPWISSLSPIARLPRDYGRRFHERLSLSAGAQSGTLEIRSEIGAFSKCPQARPTFYKQG